MVKPSAQNAKNFPVGYFGLTIALGIRHRREVLLDDVAFTPIFEQLYRELPPVIGNKSTRDAKPVDDVVSYKLFNHLLSVILASGSASTHLEK